MISKSKKIFYLLISMLFIASLLTACGTKNNTNTEGKSNGSSVASKPVKLQIIDVAGTTQLVKPALDSFKAKHPELVSDIEIIKATAPELASKIKAQQMANNLETTLVLTGYDGLASGTELGIWEKLMPDYSNQFPNLEANYLEGAEQAFKVGNGYGITIAYCPGGPMLTYNPDKVKEVLNTPEKLLEWAKANPGKFMYARPANSGPGRAFLQGLPYLLGDKDPKDPKTWDKTWAYLKELDKYIDYYPTGTSITFKELAEGSRWVVASHIGWDMNQRILGIIPQNFQGSFFDHMIWVTDAHYACIPKGLDNDRKNAALALIKWLLEPENQAVTFDDGYFYPGPAVKNVTLSMAPKESQDKIKAAMREEYDNAIKTYPTVTQLDAKAMVEAFDMWDKLIGAKVKK